VAETTGTTAAMSANPRLDPRMEQWFLNSHPVQVGFRSAREVKVDDDIDCLNVDTTSKEICQSAEILRLPSS
jgi:hypothetical protein